MYYFKRLVISTFLLCVSHYSQAQWTDLLDEDLTHWDIFMGIPHKSAGIEGYENVEDVRIGKPLGLHKDPKHVFTVSTINDERVLHISGEIFASLATKSNYRNYHLKTQFKWGDKKWEPRLDERRNSGILYHSVGAFDFWNVWMTSLEFEVQQGDTGDFIVISKERGGVRADVPCTLVSPNNYQYATAAETMTIAWHDDFATPRCAKGKDAELTHGEWNEIELITYEGTSIHVVNGNVVMTVHNPQRDENGQLSPMREGKIQMQSEAAQVFYKNINIKILDKMPTKYASMIKK